MSEVAMVVVSFHSGPQIAELLRTTADTATPLSITVANNAVGDDLRPYLVGRKEVTLEEMGDNLGYGSAVNEAIRRRDALPDWILVANPDVEFGPGAIDRMVEVGDSDPVIGVVGPQILTPAGEVYPSARPLPSLRTGVGHALFSRIWRHNPWTRRYLADRELPPRQREAGWLSGSCMLVRGSAFHELGGFDEDFFMYFEDVDLSRRISAAGYRVVYAPAAVVVHSGAHATSSSGRAMIRAHHASAYRYMARKYSAWYLWPLRAALRVGLGIRSRLVRR